MIKARVMLLTFAVVASAFILAFAVYMPFVSALAQSGSCQSSSNGGSGWQIDSMVCGNYNSAHTAFYQILHYGARSSIWPIIYGSDMTVTGKTGSYTITKTTSASALSFEGPVGNYIWGETIAGAWFANALTGQGWYASTSSYVTSAQ